MTKRIYRAICIASLSVFLVNTALILAVVYGSLSTVSRHQLQAETALAAQGVEKLGSAYFDNLNTSGFRIT